MCIRDSYWAIPGTEGAAHRLGGLEKDYDTGAISTDAINHERMVYTRREKIARIADDIPQLEVLGDEDADILLTGWGGTYGHLRTAAAELRSQGKKIAFTHFRYINPLPSNTGEVLRRFKKVVVAELNTGQFADYLQGKYLSLIHIFSLAIAASMSASAQGLRKEITVQHEVVPEQTDVTMLRFTPRFTLPQLQRPSLDYSTRSVFATVQPTITTLGPAAWGDSIYTSQMCIRDRRRSL